MDGKKVDVLGDTGLVKNAGQLSIGHQELGSQGDVPLVPGASIGSENLRGVRSDLLGSGGLGGGLIALVTGLLSRSPTLVLGLPLVVLELLNLFLALFLLPSLLVGPSELLPHLPTSQYNSARARFSYGY